MSTVDALGGTCPKGWELTTIGEICDRFGGEVQTGPFGSQLHAEDYVVDGVPSVMPKDIIGDRISSDSIARVSEEDAARLAVHRLQPGDIVYARRGDIGRRALVTELEAGWLCGTGCLRIRLNCPKIASDYILAYLGHPEVRAWVESRAQGATMLNLNTSILRNVPLRIPPLPEQRRIADILDKADTIRRKRKEAITLTEDLLRSAFLEMFGDPGRNEKKWLIKPLGELLAPGETINYGVVQPGLEVSGGIPIVRVGDFDEMCINHENLKRISREIEAQYARSRLQGDEILLACVGSIGKVALADAKLAGANIARAVARIRPSSSLRRTYLGHFLCTPFAQRHFHVETRTVSQPTLNIKQIQETPVVVPPMNLQVQFEDLESRIRGMQHREREALSYTDHLFSSLVDRAFRGELTAPSASQKKQLDMFDALGGQ